MKYSVIQAHVHEKCNDYFPNYLLYALVDVKYWWALFMYLQRRTWKTVWHALYYCISVRSHWSQHPKVICLNMEISIRTWLWWSWQSSVYLTFITTATKWETLVLTQEAHGMTCATTTTSVNMLPKPEEESATLKSRQSSWWPGIMSSCENWRLNGTLLARPCQSRDQTERQGANGSGCTASPPSYHCCHLWPEPQPIFKAGPSVFNSCHAFVCILAAVGGHPFYNCAS